MNIHSTCTNSGEMNEHLTLDTPHTYLYPIRYFVHKKTSTNNWLADSQLENLDGTHGCREVNTAGCYLHICWLPPSSILSFALQRLENQEWHFLDSLAAKVLDIILVLHSDILGSP